MTKDEIISIAKKFGLATWHNDMKRWTLEVGLEQFTSEIEAFTAAKARQPLTEDAVIDAFCTTPNIHQHVSSFKAGVRFAERAHGITMGQQ